MRAAIYPGSFDPITLGHLDIIKRSARVFDRVIVAIMVNPQKNPLFSVEERKTLIAQSVQHLANVQIDSFPGLLVDYVRRNHVDVIIKGLRAVSDFEAELQMALMNRKLYAGAETFFIPTDAQYSYISSSLVKEIARHGGDVKDLVPDPVWRELRNKYRHMS
ncbi:pantetheine-phosphate adenylyltransferase [Fodinisporobacter ferrooxydans]|uniref:Phosphopantetheine adenylyltransferase n=1 Tax=Fodinisporobacter ferrooxydans TaxID=2901836 RepID=A0ABY4CFA5_9BACL|nr:pantetheine-phosphate adenylyltransferase [Alicyclobacillaceae bacterium MYW30-H2]